jgi:hypothetical protein
MAYVDEGHGEAIVFAPRQPAVDALDVTHARIVDPWAVAALHLQIPTWLA